MLGDVHSVLNLPLETLVVLAVGYMGYWIASVGNLAQHRSVQIVFSSLIFAAVTKLLILWITAAGLTTLPSILLASVLVVALATVWRAMGYALFLKLFRRLNISWSDGKRTVWDTVRLGTKYRVSQLVVRKVDGSQFMCDDMQQFSNSPHGPVLYGEDGSIGLYVTDFRRKPGDEWTEVDPKEKNWGDFFTVIPANQISDVKLRLN